MYGSLEIQRNGKPETVKSASQVADAARDQNLKTLEGLFPFLGQGFLPHSIDSPFSEC